MKTQLACAAALLALAACGPREKAETVVTDKGPGGETVTVTSPSGTVTVTDGGGMTVTSGGATAGDAAFPLAYPGGQQVMDVNSNDNGKPGRLYGFNTSDSPEKVMAFYKAKAEAAGMKETATVTTGESLTYGASGEKGDFAVVIARQGPQNYVQATWSGK